MASRTRCHTAGCATTTYQLMIQKTIDDNFGPMTPSTDFAIAHPSETALLNVGSQPWWTNVHGLGYRLFYLLQCMFHQAVDLAVLTWHDDRNCGLISTSAAIG